MFGQRATDAVSKITTLEPGSVFVGDLIGDDNYIVHGRVEGNGDVHGVLMLGEGCRWKGDIKADVVILKGIVQGNITARDKVELRETARLLGELQSPVIAIAHGAAIKGGLPEGSLITRFEDKRD